MYTNGLYKTFCFVGRAVAEKVAKKVVEFFDDLLVLKRVKKSFSKLLLCISTREIKFLYLFSDLM